MPDDEKTSDDRRRPSLPRIVLYTGFTLYALALGMMQQSQRIDALAEHLSLYRQLSLLLVLLLLPTLFALAAAFLGGGLVALVQTVRAGEISTGLRKMLRDAVLLSAILLLLGFLPLRVLPRPLPLGAHQLRFESRTWKSSGKSGHLEQKDGQRALRPRQKMIADLVEEHLPKMDRASTLLNLGGGTPHKDFMRAIPKDCLVYYTGPPRNPGGFIEGPEHLQICFAPDGSFKDYRIWNIDY